MGQPRKPKTRHHEPSLGAAHDPLTGLTAHLADINSCFTALAALRAQGKTPSRFFFPQALHMPWVGGSKCPNHKAIETRPPLSEAEMLAVAGAPVIQINSDHLSHNRLAPGRCFSADQVEDREEEIMEQLAVRGLHFKFNPILEDTGDSLDTVSYRQSASVKGSFNGLAKLRPARNPLPELQVPSPFASSSVPRAAWTILMPLPKSLTEREVWLYHTKIRAHDLRRLPNCRDLPLLLQLHEIGHTLQPCQTKRSMSYRYKEEYHADRFALAAYAHLGGSPGFSEAVTAMALATSLSTYDFSCRDYWFSPALLAGPHGLNIWSLQRSSQAMLELRFLVASEISCLHGDRLHHAYDAMRDQSPEAINTHSHLSAHEKSRSGIDRRMALPRLESLARIWQSQTKLSPEAQCVAGAVLEAASLFWPHLTQPKALHAPMASSTKLVPV